MQLVLVKPRIFIRGFYFFPNSGNILSHLCTNRTNRMFTRVIISILFLCYGSFVPAQKPASSLLWEVTGNGINHPSYLFGTFHIICKDEFPITDILKAKIEQSKQFYGELNLDDPNLQMTLMQKMMSAKTLQSQMTEEEFKQLSKKFKEITQLPIDVFNQFKPFLAISLLSIQTIPCTDNIQPDMEFSKIAKAKGIPINGLESIQDEIDAIDKEPLDSQIVALKKMVMNFDSVKNQMTDLLHVYYKRNVDSLFAYMQTTGASDDFSVEMLDKRNAKWIPVIKKAIKEESCFFAMGAGHLGGQEGIINLLRKEGFLVKPLNY